MRRRYEDLKHTTRIRRERQSNAVIAYAESLENESSAPERETRCERRVRILENILRRFELEERAKVPPHDYRSALYWQKKRIELLLVLARRDLKFERGDF